MAEAEIKTIISANTASFEAGLAQAVSALKKAEGKFAASNKKTQSSFQALGNSVKTLGAGFATAAVINYGKNILNVADNLKTLSERTNVSVKFFSALQPEIENAGGSLEDFATAINKLNINVSDALSGDKGAIDKFKKLGVNVSELDGKSAEQQLLIVSTALSKLSTRGEQASAATDLMGKSVIGILPSLSKGGEYLNAFADAAVKSGNAVSDEAVARLDDFGDALNTIRLNFQNGVLKSFADFLGIIDGLGARYTVLTKIGDGLGYIGDRLSFINNLKNLPQALGTVNKAIEDANAKDYSEKSAAAGFTTDISGGQGQDLAAQFAAQNKPKKRADLSGGAEKAASNAEKLTEALSKLQRQTSRDIYTSGLTPLEAKLKEVDFTVEDLARQYKTKLTPEMERYGDTAKANIEKLDGIERVGKLAEDMGSAFSDAFEQGILGAESFGDVLSSLANQLQKIFFQQAVTQPLTDAFKGLLGGAGGEGGLFGGIGDSLSGIFGSFATGTRNVPRDMTARLHKGETVMTRQETDAMQKNGSKSQGSGNTYQIDARGADQGAVMRIEKALIALAGPGVIERRVVNAQTRGAL